MLVSVWLNGVFACLPFTAEGAMPKRRRILRSQVSLGAGHEQEQQQPPWQTRHQLARWDESLAQAMPPVALDTATALLAHGLLGSTDYSGADMAVDSIEIALGIVALAAGRQRDARCIINNKC